MVQLFITVRVLEQLAVVTQSSNAREILKNDSMEPSACKVICQMALILLLFIIHMMLLNSAGLDDPNMLVAMTLTV